MKSGYPLHALSPSSGSSAGQGGNGASGGRSVGGRDAHQTHPQQRVIVPSLATTWFSDVVLPVIIVGVVVILSLFAIIVLLLLRRHLQYESEGSRTSRYDGGLDEDRSALTPGSVRRHSPPLLHLEIGQHHTDPLQPHREELFLC